MQVQVLERRAASVVMTTDDLRGEYSSKGLLTKATVWSVDVDPSATQTNADRENIIELSAEADNGSALVWTSSNPKVATVVVEDGKAVVQGRKAGTVKITATAQDGSQKKAYITLKVVVPASGLTLYSTRRQAEIGGSKYYVVSPGKSIPTKASL
jgi:ribosomal protein S8E